MPLIGQVLNDLKPENDLIMPLHFRSNDGLNVIKELLTNQQKDRFHPFSHDLRSRMCSQSFSCRFFCVSSFSRAVKALTVKVFYVPRSCLPNWYALANKVSRNLTALVLVARAA